MSHSPKITTTFGRDLRSLNPDLDTEHTEKDVTACMIQLNPSVFSQAV
jgi:hypothetical protein